MFRRRSTVFLVVAGFIFSFLFSSLSSVEAKIPVEDETDLICPVSGSIFEESKGIKTALGCIPAANTNAFYNWLTSWIFGVTGGISFLLMVYGFIKMSTSAGDPEAVKGAKETITSAISGLLLALFGLFILKLIAIDVLHIPGLSR